MVNRPISRLFGELPISRLGDSICGMADSAIGSRQRRWRRGRRERPRGAYFLAAVNEPFTIPAMFMVPFIVVFSTVPSYVTGAL